MSSFSLNPATESDIPTLAQIAHSAFAKDRHTQLKASNPVRPYNHGETMREALQSWFARPKGKVHLIKAVDETTGKPVGWVCWGNRGLEPSLAKTVKPDQATQTAGSSDKETTGSSAESTSGMPPKSTHTEDPLCPLNSITSQSMQDWMAKLMPEGARCMYIMSIAVDPTYTNRGVGRALVKYGTDLADEVGVFCWVHSSPAGTRLFESCEFREVGRLEIDLDEWANKIEKQTGKQLCSGTTSWGLHVFKYMRRASQAEMS